ncbi:B3/4 domain-containing protein [Streptomyces sp. NRRL F-5123]|uniref:B3/B4 domain-containing protein n=1 Tax=Streptomyces sp. NRRL F-5123 TaxID=1463856 RepID=UPI0004E2553B|nr:phenylalanine--tRNA ligase beta subunit-related protein [Streptomyces sp. NRRL F-5123]
MTLSDDVARAFPEAQIRLLVARGLTNDTPWPEVDIRCKELTDAVAAGTAGVPAEDDPRITSWHDAYRSFGSNPRRTRSSVDALTRRLSRNGVLPRISGAVDAYNVVCVTFGTPAGAFDLDRLSERVDIRPSRPGDWFVPLGEPDAREEPRPGEVVYAQGQQVLTRHWNHRDADATKVTAATRDAVFLLERVSRTAVPDEQLDAAHRALEELVRPHAGQVSLLTVDALHPTADLNGG